MLDLPEPAHPVSAAILAAAVDRTMT